MTDAATNTAIVSVTHGGTAAPAAVTAGTAPGGGLLDRYACALECFDVETLVTLLHPEASMTLQPGRLRLQGRLDICRWLLEEGSAWHRIRLVPATGAGGGSAAFGVYRPTGRDGSYQPYALQVVEVAAGRVSAVRAFVDPNLFPLFDLAPVPPRPAPGCSGTPAT